MSIKKLFFNQLSLIESIDYTEKWELVINQELCNL
jgi:hypothetical protein